MLPYKITVPKPSLRKVVGACGAFLDETIHQTALSIVTCLSIKPVSSAA